MDLRQSIDKFKRAIFVKKGVGQDYKAEEGALTVLEEQLKAKEAERKALDQAIETTGKQISNAEKKAKSLKEQLIDKTSEYQALALKLFQAEREGETLFEERAYLYKKAGIGTDRRAGFQKSFYIGSQRAWWAENELNPLSEDFRRDLILDNRDYVQKKRGGRKPRRAKVPEKHPVFIPDQAAAFMELGIPMQKWMEQAWLKQANVQMKKDINEIKSMTRANLLQ